MARTLFLHIGCHRTATTSTQRFLHRNVDRLVARGVLYPFGVQRHERLVRALLQGERNCVELAADITARADAREHPVDRIVLSDEDICRQRDLSLFTVLREQFDVKVIYTLRRQDLWLESWYVQNIKWQWVPALSHCTFDEFMALRQRFHWIWYDRYITHLEELFGAENVLINVFEPGQMPDGPVATFCRMIGIEDMSGLFAPVRENASIAPESVEIMRHLPLGDIPLEERRLINQAIFAVDAAHFGAPDQRKTLLMSPDQRQAVLAEHTLGNQSVAKRYFGRDALFLDPVTAADAPIGRLALPEQSSEMLEKFVGPLLLELVKRNLISVQKPIS